MEQTAPSATGPETMPDAPRWSTAVPYAPPQPMQRAGTDWERVARNWFLVLALIVLSLSLLTGLIALNQAVTIWLQPQYAPFVRAAGAAVVAAGALFVILRLTRRPR